jgi:hypothetical protein
MPSARGQALAVARRIALQQRGAQRGERLVLFIGKAADTHATGNDAIDADRHAAAESGVAGIAVERDVGPLGAHRFAEHAARSIEPRRRVGLVDRKRARAQLHAIEPDERDEFAMRIDDRDRRCLAARLDGVADGVERRERRAMIDDGCRSHRICSASGGSGGRQAAGDRFACSRRIRMSIRSCPSVDLRRCVRSARTRSGLASVA